VLGVAWYVLYVRANGSTFVLFTYARGAVEQALPGARVLDVQVNTYPESAEQVNYVHDHLYDVTVVYERAGKIKNQHSVWTHREAVGLPAKLRYRDQGRSCGGCSPVALGSGPTMRALTARHSMFAPNTRMQRTRSSPSPPRSPLMRCPLGGREGRRKQVKPAAPARWALLAVSLLCAASGCAASRPDATSECGEERAIARGLAWIGTSDWESLSVQAVKAEWPTALKLDDSCLRADVKCDLATLTGPSDGAVNGSCKYIVDFRLSSSVDGGKLASQVGLRGVFVNQTFAERATAVKAVRLWFASQPIPPDQFPKDADFEGDEVSASWLPSGAPQESRSAFAVILPVESRWAVKFRLARSGHR